MLMHEKQLQLLLAEEGPIAEHHLTEVMWRRGDLEFLLWEQQYPIWELLQNLPPHIVEFVVLCARQFGKSTLGIIRALSQGIKHRDKCILIMGPDTKQTKDIVLPKMRMLTRTAPKGLIVPMRADNRFHVYHDLRREASDFTEIIIGGMNENSSSQRGKTVQEVLIEEIVDLHEDEYLDSLRSDLGPALTHSKGGKIIFLTTLPKVPDHPFITETMVKAELNEAIAVFTIHDNKALTPEQYQACVERSGGEDSIDFQREYMCRSVRDTKIVCLPDFSLLENVKPFEIPTWSYMQTTIDWGGVRDKTCAVLHTYDYLQDLDLFIDERVFEPNTSTEDIVKECKAMEALWLKAHTTKEIKARFIDAPQQLVSVDLVQSHNYHAAIPYKNDWESCLNSANVRFQRRKALIHPRCKFLIQSANSGILNKTRTAFDRTEALGHMDGVATMMYAIRMVIKTNPYPAIDGAGGFTTFQNKAGRVNSEPQVGQAKPHTFTQGSKAFGKFRR